MKKNKVTPKDEVTSFSYYKSHFINSVKTHLGQVPYILWYPIASVISLLYALVHTVYHKISDTFRRPVLDQNRLTQLTRKAVRSVLRSSGGMVSVSGNQMVCRIFTALLQLLSAITTYAGFSYYLSPINPIAPLLLAVVVQGLCFYLLNYTAARKRTGGSLRAFLLAVVLLISSFTSFIGISNVVQSPVDDMKNQYAAYRQAHNGMLDALIGKPDIDEGSIRQLLTKGKNLLSQAQKTATSRKNIRGTMNPNQVTETVNPDGTRTTSRSQNADILNQIGQQSGKIDELDNKIAAMKTALTPFETLGFGEAAKKISAFYDEVYAESSAKITLSPSKEYLEYIACLNAASELQDVLNALGSVKGSADPFAVSRYTIPLEQISAWNGLRLLPFEEIRNGAISTSGTMKKKNLFAQLNDYIIPPDISGAQLIHDKLKQEMDDKFHELYPTLNARDATQADTLKSQYENSALESPQILPLNYLFSGTGTHSRGLSLFSLGLAVLTDLLSLLMSLALVKRRDSILYASSHAGSARNREELLEDCYTYICLRGLMGQTQKSGRMHTRKSVETYVCRAVEGLMHSFFEKIRQEHLPPKLGSYGFIDAATFDALSTDEKDLFQTLQNIHMIHPVAQFEILELLRDEFEDGTNVKDGEPRPTAPLEERYRALFPDDEITYLVDKKFLIWYNETFSELLGGGAVDYGLLESTTPEEPGIKEAPAKEEQSWTLH